MEALGFAIRLGFELLVLSVPIVCVLKGYGFFRTNLVSIPCLIVVMAVWAYFIQFYADFRLDLMGFDFYGMSDAERLSSVAPELRDKATALYLSTMGIGWPLKAIFGVIFIAPYPSMVWGIWAGINSLLKRAY